MSHVPSPGNQLTPQIAPMRLPHLEHEYRLIAEMAGGYEISKMNGAGISRSIGVIAGGTIDGPRIKGKVLEHSGADWALRIHAEKVSALPCCFSHYNGRQS